MQQADRDRCLARCFEHILNETERALVGVEGWILCVG
jgi:hypothetical protein